MGLVKSRGIAKCSAFNVLKPTSRIAIAKVEYRKMCISLILSGPLYKADSLLKLQVQNRDKKEPD